LKSVGFGFTDGNSRAIWLLLEREEWREINDILKVNGFGWLSNDKDSCWIKIVN
jgi:hypothetical protein